MQNETEQGTPKLIETWDVPFHSMQERLEICAGAVNFERKVVANLRRQLAEKEAEIANLKHDIERHVAIAADECERAERAEAEARRCAEDEERLDWIQQQILAADFDYGEQHENVLVLRWPNSPLGANIRANIDAARSAKP